MTTFAVELDAVEKSFGSRRVVDGASIAVERGERLALIGPSGCGKSTLLKMILGLVVPDAGRVRIAGTLVSAENARALRRRIGYVIQDGGLFPHLTARENVTLVARLDGQAATTLEPKVTSLAELVRLTSAHLDRYPRELSGGERQRVGLMRALMLDPDVLLLDEPLGALDPIVRAQLQEDLRRVFGELEKSVVIVTHDLAEAAYLAPSIAIVHDGKIEQRAGMRELVDAPASDFVRSFVGAQKSLGEALR